MYFYVIVFCLTLSIYLSIYETNAHNKNTQITLERPCFLMRLLSQILGVKTSTYLLEDTIKPITLFFCTFLYFYNEKKFKSIGLLKCIIFN